GGALWTAPPFALSLAVGVFLTAQIGAAGQGAKTIEWQIGNVQKQIEQTKAHKEAFGKALAESDKAAKQSASVLETYNKLFNELVDLAQTDPDAAKVTAKWKINRPAATNATPAADSVPPATTPSPAPSATP
ncbi:MAG: hypothetical protein ABI680_02300, partial [Chthoniobacteraceae bacterium]